MKPDDEDAIPSFHWLVGAYHEPPVLTIIRPQPGYLNATRYSGFIKDIIDHLSRAIGFTYEFVDVFAAREVNKTIGPSDELISLMMRKEIDITARMLILTAERNSLIDFATPAFIEPMVILQPMPRVKNEFSAVLQPFRLSVWAAFLVTFLLTSAFLTCTSVMSSKRSISMHQKSVSRIAGDIVMYVFSIFTTQGGEVGNRWIPTCLIAGSWCLAAVVIVNGYNSTLTSFLSVRSYNPVVQTWEDLAQNHNIKLIVERNSVVEDIIMKTTSGPLASLAETLRGHPEHRFRSFKEYKLLTQAGMFALPLQKLAAQERVYSAMKANKGECQLTFGSPMNSYSTIHSLPITKGFHFTKTINQVLLVMIGTGILERMKFAYLGKTDVCSVKTLTKNKNAKLTPLKLRSFYGLFIILGLGYSLAILTFIAERVVGSMAKRNTRVRRSDSRRILNEH